MKSLRTPDERFARVVIGNTGLPTGAQGQPHTTVMNAHHFFQEDAAPELAQIILDAIGRG